MDVYFRKAPVIFSKRRMQVAGSWRGIYADRQPAILASAPASKSPQFVLGIFKNAAAELEELEASEGGPGATVCSFEQYGAEPFFKIM
jgi:hypothetical protein